MTEILPTRRALLEKFPKGKVVAEIGVFEGTFSRIIDRVMHPARLFLVDPWEGFVRSGDKNGNNVRRVNLDRMELKLARAMPGRHIRICKTTSQEFLNSLPDGYLDVIYLDAVHTYSFVKADLELAVRKVCRGGWLAGHDYHSEKFDFSGVKRAVDEFCQGVLGRPVDYLTQDGCQSWAIRNSPSPVQPA